MYSLAQSVWRGYHNVFSWTIKSFLFTILKNIVCFFYPLSFDQCIVCASNTVFCGLLNHFDSYGSVSRRNIIMSSVGCYILIRTAVSVG